MTEREAADRLKLMPNYVAILERDDYKALRSPPFARGYVKAYGRMLGMDEEYLVSVFDQLNIDAPTHRIKRKEVRPLQLQRTGLGVVIGLGVLLVLVAVLWWWDKTTGELSLSADKSAAPAQTRHTALEAGGEK
jgi:cytoskeleton protein RodZ